MNALEDMGDSAKLFFGIAIIAALSVAGTALMADYFEVLTPTRPYEVGTQEGASHATKRDQFEQITNRRRQDESGLTQQATNNTCVTARRDEP